MVKGTLESLPVKRVPGFVSDSWSLIKREKVKNHTFEYFEVNDDWHPKSMDISWRVVIRKNEIDWENQPLGEMKDRDLAEQLGVSESQILNKRKKYGIPSFNEPRVTKKIDWSKEPLGEVPDTEIAKKHGIDKRSVGRARKRLGIKPYAKNWSVNWNEQPLGQESDVILAKKLGVTASAVGSARIRRGIAAHRKYRRAEK